MTKPNCRRNRMVEAQEWWESFYYWATHSATGGGPSMISDDKQADLVRYALQRCIKDIEQESGCMILETSHD